MPKISVIVPVYKVEPYLERCVQSILGQTFTDFELILVDDGSPDNCPAMCDEYAKQDERVVVIHQENGGLSAARNAGIDWTFANSDSEWLTFTDSDDWVHPEYLERLYNAVVENNVLISVCGFERTEGDEPIIDKETLTPVIWTPEDFYVEHNVNAVVAWGKLYRKELFKDIRYPVGKIHEDEFTTHKLLFQCEMVVVIEAPLYAYYVNESGIMKSASLYCLDAFEAWEQQECFFDQRGLLKARKNTVRIYLTYINKYLNECAKDHKEYSQTIKELKRKRKRAFKKSIGLFNLEDDYDAWLMTQIYPYRMKMKWIFISLKKRIYPSK